MSRAERRQYQRMMRGAEQDPLAPRRPGRSGRGGSRPAPDPRVADARQRASRPASQPSRGEDAEKESVPLTARIVVRSLLIAALVGYLAFSLQWPNMPFALYFGIGVGVVAAALLIALRRVQFRMPQPPPG